MTGKVHHQTLLLTVKNKKKSNKDKNNIVKKRKEDKDNKIDLNKICKPKFKLIWLKKESN